MTNETLGPYRLAGPLGKGGMGAVFRAKHIDTGDDVAVKVLSPRLAVAEGFRDRFEGEIESLKALRHVGIVRLLGYGEQDGVLFYAMELIDGPSLEEELRAGRRFDWRETTQIAVQVCRALKHAHDHGVVHRDLKPANILLTPTGDAKLADFGIARMFGSTGVTIAGGVLGTADYMSPEQAAGTPVTARCDQYSLGGVMYALLTGRPPFRAADMAAMLQLQRFAIPEPVRRFAPDTPLELERVIGKLLEKDPANRFPNTRVVARRLEAMSQALARVAADDFELRATQAREAHQRGDDDELATALTRDAAATLPPANAAAAAGNSAEGGGFSNGGRTYVPVLAAPDAEESARWITFAGPAAMLATVLASVAAAAWWFTRPLTADALYDRAAERVEAGDLTAATRSLAEEFTRRFADDPRAEEVALWGRNVELELQRRRMRLARWIGGAGESPGETLMRRAAELAGDDPVAGAEAYAAVGALLRSVAEPDAAEASLAEVAERETLRLREESEARLRRERAFFAERLEAAAGGPSAESVARAVLLLAPASPETAALRARAREIVAGAASAEEPVASDEPVR